MNKIRDIVFNEKSKLRLKENYIESIKHRLEELKIKENEMTDILKNQLDHHLYKDDHMMSFATMTDQNGIKIPRWMPNPLSKQCKLCFKKFGLITRKHHCRVCGDIFCAKCCSIFDSFMPHYKNNVRMCIECHKSKKK